MTHSFDENGYPTERPHTPSEDSYEAQDEDNINPQMNARELYPTFISGNAESPLTSLANLVLQRVTAEYPSVVISEDTLWDLLLQSGPSDSVALASLRLQLQTAFDRANSRASRHSQLRPY
jgi:hypothetical protein